MRKAKARGRRATKQKGAAKNFAGYLARVPNAAARRALVKMRSLIRSAMPRDASETISYKIPAFRDDNGIIVWFAAFSDHCSLFPKASIIEAFRAELKGFTTSKGTVQFSIDTALPAALITKLVKARVAEHKAAKRR